MADRPDVSIVHPMDPAELGPGGFDTCIADLIKHCPPELTIELVGVTANQDQRPVGWRTRLAVAGRRIDFLPLLADSEPDRIRPLPLSLRFAAAGRWRRASTRGRIVQFHRFESSFATSTTADQHVLHFVHNHPPELARPKIGVRWRWLRPLFLPLFLRHMRGAQAIFAVDPRTGPSLAARGVSPPRGVFDFKVWADPDTFHLAPGGSRVDRRRALLRQHGLEEGARLIVFAGRLVRQKNLGTLVTAVAELRAAGQPLSLLIVGRGPFRSELEARIRSMGLEKQARITPMVRRARVAGIYQSCDLVACSSFYEGGPRAVVEALACGAPVVATRVGQAAKILAANPAAGTLAEGPDAESLARAIARELARPLDSDRERACLRAVQDYQPAAVLQAVYELYRSILGT